MRMCRLTVGAIATNCYIVYNELSKKAVIIDPGAQADRIIGKITELGLEVEGILLTHGHFDHMGAVDQLREHYGTKVYLGEKDKELISNAQQNVSALFGTPITTKADLFLKDGEALAIADLEFTVLETPGHTPGGVCYYLKEEEVAFSGDTLFQGSVGRTDFPTGSARALIDSIKEKLLVLGDDTQLFPGHGDSTTVAYEKKYNMFL